MAPTPTMPFSIHQAADHPLSLYGATKKANELMAHSYAHLYGLPVTGLRFFTVYGPWGRPDMSVFIFTQKILDGDPIEVFNNGNHSRDFTYIDDIVRAIVRSCDRVATPNPAWSGAKPDPATSSAPYQALQHRQSLAGCVDGLHRLHRARCRQTGDQDTSYQCRPATCSPRSPTSAIQGRTLVSSRRLHWRKASGALWPGIASITASSCKRGALTHPEQLPLNQSTDHVRGNDMNLLHDGGLLRWCYQG